MTRRKGGHDNQLSLFGDLGGAPRAPSSSTLDVETAGDDDAEHLAQALPSWLRFGTSSWTCPGWAGLVYAGAPSQAELVRSGLGAYARHPLMRTVGIDRSHYAPIPREELARYAEQLPRGFLAVSKVWDTVTTYVFPKHPRYGERAGERNPRFLDPQFTADEVLASYADVFAEHAGPFVFEIPPMPRSALPADKQFVAALEQMFRTLPERFRYAVELRNRELLTPRYLAMMRAHGAAHVLNFWSRMPPVGEQLALPGVLTAPFAVLRLLLPPGADYEQKGEEFAPFSRIVTVQPEMRDDVVEFIGRWGETRAGDAFVLVNNKAEGCAPLTIKALAEQVVACAASTRPL